MLGNHQFVGNPSTSHCAVLGFALLVLSGCDHSLHIEGAGDIVSLTGNRNCSLEQQPCQNLVINHYQETYTAVARDAWTFVQWEGCPGEQQTDPASCSFDVPAELVNANWGAQFSLKAVFGDTTPLADLEFDDPNLETCVKIESLATYIYELEELYCWQQLQSLEGIQNLTSLRSLEIPSPGTDIEDYTPLIALPRLRRLDVSNHTEVQDRLPTAGLNLDWLKLNANAIELAFWLENLPAQTRIHVSTGGETNFAWLSDIPRLAGITLGACPADLDWLTGFSGLKEFGFAWDTHCSKNYDLSPLADLQKLTQLRLYLPGVTDISALSSLHELSKLFLWASVDNMDALGGLDTLTWLNFKGNDNPDISALSGLVNLEELRIFSIGISDISAVANLYQLTLFYAMDNNISDISALAGLTKLRDLRISRNNIDNIAPLSAMSEMRILELYSNQITDIGPLSNLTSLSWLELMHNRIVDVSPLASLTSLELLDISSNVIGGLDVGNIDQLVTLTALKGLDVNDNPSISCLELETLVAALDDAAYVHVDEGKCTTP